MKQTKIPPQYLHMFQPLVSKSRVELSGVVTSLCSNAKEQGQKWITGRRKADRHSRMQSC